jgi:nucleotide-binding universal stress UspA family protein
MTLVVGYDGDPSSRVALTAAIALAQDLDESLVLVCGVAPAGGLGEEYTAVEDAVVEVLSPLVTAAVGQAREAGVAATAMLVDASPTEALITAAVEHSARMIVVGYGATGRIRAALMGAVAHRVLNESEIPVLVVP